MVAALATLETGTPLAKTRAEVEKNYVCNDDDKNDDCDDVNENDHVKNDDCDDKNDDKAVKSI